MSWLRLIEESVAEKSEAAETSAAAQVSKPKKEGWQRLIHLVKEMWPAYLIEVLVIVLGISITLALEEWRDGRKEEKLEKVYLTNLSADIAADLQALKSTSAATHKLLESGDHLLAFVRSGDVHSMELSTIGSNVRGILDRPKFVAHDATFSDLKSSGNLALIKDITLKNLLFSYYNLIQVIKEDQDAEQQSTITLSGPFFLKEFSLLGNAPQIEATNPDKLLNSPGFRNNVLLRVSNRNELLHLYESADSMANTLRARLSNEQH